MNAPDRWDYTFYLLYFIVFVLWISVTSCLCEIRYRNRDAQVFDGSAPVFTWAMLYTVYRVVFEAQVYVDIRTAWHTLEAGD